MTRLETTLAHISNSILSARQIFPRGLVQPARSYRFGSDALLLAAFGHWLVSNTPGLFRKRQLRAAELGCGCGAALLGFAMSYEKSVCLGIEREPELVEAARKNATGLGLDDRVSFLECDLEAEHMPPKPCCNTINMVFANPPWHPDTAGRESQDRLRQRALHGDALAAFCQAASRLLVWHGYFCLIITPEIFCSLCAVLASSNIGARLIMPIASHQNECASRLLVMARKEADAAPQFFPPLVLHEASGDCTAASVDFCPWLARKSV